MAKQVAGFVGIYQKGGRENIQSSVPAVMLAMIERNSNWVTNKGR
jgi:hypothetical protein